MLCLLQHISLFKASVSYSSVAMKLCKKGCWCTSVLAYFLMSSI